jgi:hypothetical protein
MIIPSKARRWVSWLCAGALPLTLGVLPSDSAVAATSYSVLQMNICNSGFADCYSGRATERSGDLINARQPSVATVNEICFSDLAPIQTKTGYAGVFTQSGSQKCRNGSAYGNALLFPAGTSVGTPYRLTYAAQSQTTELRTLTCAAGAGVTACVTHLTPDSDRIKSQQAAQMKEVVGNDAGRGPTVLGGDWNMTYGGSPNAQDYVPAGMFRKGDAVQHIMATSAHFGFESTRVMRLDWTDHPGLQVYLAR